MKKKHSRRRVLRSAVALGMTGAAGKILADTPTTQPDAISTSDLEATDRVLGRSFTAEQREMMASGMAERRKLMVALRQGAIDPSIEPAVQFNPRLPDTPLPRGESSFTMSDGPVPPFDGDVEKLALATAAELSRLIHARRVSSMELTKMYLARLERFDPKLNCVVALTRELALAQAKRADEELSAGKSRGPLHGIPYGAKDLLATKGIPTTWGAQPYAEQVFDFDATVVQRLEAAGAVLLAKLSLGELAMGDVWFKGRTNNPWNPKSGSGGSSAGPAAAAAAGLVGFAIGSETYGSIISPCMITGVTGLRPTWGRVSRYGAMPLARSMDKIGPMTRGVEDCAMVLAAIHGADGLDSTAVGDVPFAWSPQMDLRSLRVGIDAAVFDREHERWKDAELRKIYDDALEVIRSLVGEPIPIALPPAERYSGVVGLTIAAESASSFSELLHSGRISELKQQGRGSWPNTFRIGSTIPAADYLRAQQVRAMLQREMADALREVDLYVTVPYAGPSIAFTNLTGHPALVTRCGMHKGQPKMIEFVGGLYREDAILRLGLAFERATSWHAQWPDMNAASEAPGN